jgi:HPt (histidine-containing phosphotransfer) domain-containing protein
MEQPPSTTPQPSLATALDRLWTRFLPEIRDRVAVIDSAVQSAAAGSLSAEQKQAAASAAHKLAGVLGTFSLQRGTELARQLELQFNGVPDSAAHLSSVASEMRSLIENRK